MPIVYKRLVIDAYAYPVQCTYEICPLGQSSATAQKHLKGILQ